MRHILSYPQGDREALCASYLPIYTRVYLKVCNRHIPTRVYLRVCNRLYIPPGYTSGCI